VDKYKSECAIKKYYSMVNDKPCHFGQEEITRENKLLVEDLCMGGGWVGNQAAGPAQIRLI
jgi:hypothetical protein